MLFSSTSADTEFKNAVGHARFLQTPESRNPKRQSKRGNCIPRKHEAKLENDTPAAALGGSSERHKGTHDARCFYPESDNYHILSDFSDHVTLWAYTVRTMMN